MTNEKESYTHRAALKGFAAGLGAVGSLPILSRNVPGQQGHSHEGHGQATKTATKKTPSLKFFTAPQLAVIGLLSELIIPADAHSPGALAAEVPAFIDLMVSESAAPQSRS